MSKFKPTRDNGVSDKQMIVNMATDSKPGTVFTLDDIIALLSKGTERVITKGVAGAAVRAANEVLLVEQKRVLRSIRGIGYQMAAAADHRPLAVDRKRRADSQMKKGLTVLSNVRWDEMNEDQKRAHEGTLMIVSGLHQAMTSISDRQDRLEALVKKMTKSS